MAEGLKQPPKKEAAAEQQLEVGAAAVQVPLNSDVIHIVAVYRISEAAQVCDVKVSSAETGRWSDGSVSDGSGVLSSTGGSGAGSESKVSV